MASTSLSIWAGDVFRLGVRDKKDKYRHRNLVTVNQYRTRYRDLSEILESQVGLQGEKITKSKSKTETEMRWRTATVPAWSRSKIDNGITSNAKIKEAIPMGVCTINEGTIYFDVSAPKTEPYFLVQVRDFRHREFYIIFQDQDKFIVALRRGLMAAPESASTLNAANLFAGVVLAPWQIPLLKVVNDDILWDVGKHQLDLSELSVNDLEMVHAATGLWTSK